jgi:hypothetical protein
MSMDILQAIDDPKVFAPAFKDPTTWASWRAYLAALFALPMTPDELETYGQCTGRQDPPADPIKESWLVVGRRGGKSFVLALIAVFLAVFKDWRPYLGPGEVGTIMVIAQDRRQARKIMEFTKGLLKGSRMLASTIKAERVESIDLKNSIRIEVHNCSFRSTRGYTCVAALLDEMAIWRSEETSANPDTEVLASIRPAMATIPGSMLLCASSPISRKGCLWEAYRKHYAKNDDPVLVWHAATRTMNPVVPQSLVDEALERDPARNAAEYLAQWRTDLEGYITREALEACVDPGVRELPPQGGVRYCAFVDPSGGSSDSFALAIAHRENGIGVLDVLREVKAPFKPSVVVEEFADVLHDYGIRTVYGDNYAKEWPIEQFAQHGIKYVRYDKFKTDIYLNALPKINSRQFRLLDHTRLVNQTLDLERDTSRGGRESINHPDRTHDDLPNAAFGALLVALVPTKQLIVGCQDGSAIRPDGTRYWPGRPERRPLRIVSITEKEYLAEKERERQPRPKKKKAG